jgi:transcriptional regulator with XRE-family HTH domain
MKETLPEPDDVDFIVSGGDPDPRSLQDTINFIKEYRRRAEYPAEAREAREILDALGINWRGETGVSGETLTLGDEERSMETSFAGKVRAILRRRKISQDDLASVLGITQPTVSQMLRGGGVKLEHAVAIARHLGVSLDHLTDDAEPLRGEKRLERDARIRELIEELGPDDSFRRLIKRADEAERRETLGPLSAGEDVSYPSGEPSSPRRGTGKSPR